MITNATLEGGRVTPLTQSPVSPDPLLEEIEVQIDLLDTVGGQYARDYFAHALGLRHRRPSTPRGMHRLIAQAVRDMAADEAMAIRLYGPHRRDFTPGTRK